MPMMTLTAMVLSTAQGVSPLPTASPPQGMRAALTEVTGMAHHAHTDTAAIDGPPWRDLPSLTDLDRTLSLHDGHDHEKTTMAAFGAAGSQRWMINGRWGVQVSDTSNNEYGVAVGLKWFLVDDFAFAPTLDLWGFSQEGDNAFGGGLDLMFEWHFINRDAWSMYVDFGCGLLGTTQPVPSGGSQFNFTPQAGLGATFDVGQDRRWIIGVRWHHISNASLYSNNPGRDSIMVYTGLSFPF